MVVHYDEDEALKVLRESDLIRKSLNADNEYKDNDVVYSS